MTDLSDYPTIEEVLAAVDGIASERKSAYQRAYKARLRALKYSEGV